MFLVSRVSHVYSPLLYVVVVGPNADQKDREIKMCEMLSFGTLAK